MVVEEPPPKRSQRPLLIGCGVVLALAAINIVVFLKMIEKNKQWRSLGAVRTLGTAVDAYATDFNKYPAPENLASELAPKYIHDAVIRDEWYNPLRYECWKEDPNAPGCDHYAVASAGADGSSIRSRFAV